jgi:hypothetical protein
MQLQAPEPETTNTHQPATPTVSFEARLAAIRDDKPLRDVRPAPIRPRAIAMSVLPAADAGRDTRRRATDIRYDEPLSTADLLELGKAMLRQPAKDGPPHRTH